MDVVREVDLEAFVAGDWGGEGVEERGECWEGARAELASCYYVSIGLRLGRGMGCEIGYRVRWGAYQTRAEHPRSP